MAFTLLASTRMRPGRKWVLLLTMAVSSIHLLAPDSFAQTTSTRPSTMARIIQVKVKHSRPMRGMTATQKVTISGSVYMDSYDSSVAPYNALLAGGNGFIGTTAKTADYLEIKGSVKLAGQLGTGAPGVMKINGGSASVGSKLWVDAGGSGLQAPSYLQDDLNVSYPDAVLPFSSSIPNAVPPSGTVNGTNYTYVIGDGTYVMDNLILGSGGRAIVNGRAVLYVRNTFDLTGGAFMRMEPGATLDIYVGGNTAINGGSIVNINGKPENLSYFGLPTNQQFYLAGNAAFIGSIYAPSAKIDFAGTSEFYGASVCKEIVLSGNFAYHYDEALAKKGIQYIPTAWKEL